MTNCHHEGCIREAQVKGFCQFHLKEAARNRLLEVSEAARARRAAATEPRPGCDQEGCSLPAHARGLCPMHYRRLRTYGSATGGPEPRPSLTRPEVCERDGCNRRHYARGLCHQHWQRDRRGSDAPGRRDSLGRRVASSSNIGTKQTAEHAAEVDAFLARAVRDECLPRYLRDPQPWTDVVVRGRP